MKFEDLLKINVNEHTENKNGLTYLSWTWAWSEFKKICPDANYEILRFGNNLPYVYDESTGYMVFTKVNDGVKTYEMWLPVMDGNNKAMLNHSYTYEVKEYAEGKFTGKYKTKTVEPASMFDINKTIMRCLVKNISMFGLGLYIYAGEDMPDGYEMTKEEAEKVLVTFGKYNGLTLKEILEKDKKYLYWLIEWEGAKESLKNACSKLITPITDEKIELLAKFEELVITTETDRDAIYKHYQVKSSNDLSIEQLNDAINLLEKKGKKNEYE